MKHEYRGSDLHLMFITRRQDHGTGRCEVIPQSTQTSASVRVDTSLSNWITDAMLGGTCVRHEKNS